MTARARDQLPVPKDFDFGAAALQCCPSTRQFASCRLHRLMIVVSYPILYLLFNFLRATAVPAGTAEARISYGNSVRLSVCLSLRPSRPGTDSMPGEIETPGLHHMVAWSI